MVAPSDQGWDLQEGLRAQQVSLHPPGDLITAQDAATRRLQTEWANFIRPFFWIPSPSLNVQTSIWSIALGGWAFIVPCALPAGQGACALLLSLSSVRLFTETSFCSHLIFF